MIKGIILRDINETVVTRSDVFTPYPLGAFYTRDKNLANEIYKSLAIIEEDDVDRVQYAFPAEHERREGKLYFEVSKKSVKITFADDQRLVEIFNQPISNLKFVEA